MNLALTTVGVMLAWSAATVVRDTFPMGERVMRTSDKILARIAFMMPRKLVYWCAMRMWAYATTGRFAGTEAPRLTVQAMFDRWCGMDNRLRQRRPRRAEAVRQRKPAA